MTMAASTSSALSSLRPLPVNSTFLSTFSLARFDSKSDCVSRSGRVLRGFACCNPSCAGIQKSLRRRDWGLSVNCANSVLDEKIRGEILLVDRRNAIGVACGFSSLFFYSVGAIAAGLPPEEKPKLCDSTCEKEIETVPMVTTVSGLQYKDIVVGEGWNPPICFQVAANYVAMVPSGQVFDSSLEKGQLYIFQVGADQVIKGLDEGILCMKIGGKRRLYIPGSLAFPKGPSSAPGRPRVAPSSPVVFNVSLEYIPGLDDE